MYSGEGWRKHYGCVACSRCYSTGGKDDTKELPVIDGPKWCFEGSCTTDPLPESDLRRNFGNSVVVISGAANEIQRKVNDLDRNAEVKVLKLIGGMDDYEEQMIDLDILLPSLDELILEDVQMNRMVLNQRSTPKLRKIWMQNPNDSGRLNYTIQCPNLEEFSIFYWGSGNYKWLQDMLNTATKLKKFDSYKLRVRHLKFASNHLETVCLHRAELLHCVDIWAPRLTKLSVQAAYDLSQVHFLKTHPLEAQLPSNFTFDEELSVNAENVDLGNQALDAIASHPRFRGTRESLQMDEDYW